MSSSAGAACADAREPNQPVAILKDWLVHPLGMSLLIAAEPFRGRFTTVHARALRPLSIESTITAEPCTTTAAAELDLPPGAPVLLVALRLNDANGNAICVGRHTRHAAHHVIRHRYDELATYA
jgi:DNA-binding GntR family transcriptional regulator